MNITPNRRSILQGAVAAAIAPTLARAATGTLHQVRIERFNFVPDRLDVRIGDRIRWTNMDLAPHTATAGDASWDSGELARGESAEIEIGQDTVPDYFCALHPHMKAQLVIT